MSSSETFHNTPQTPTPFQSPLVPRDHPEEPLPLRLPGLLVPLPPGGAHHYKPTGPGDRVDTDGGGGLFNWIFIVEIIQHLSKI